MMSLTRVDCRVLCYGSRMKPEIQVTNLKNWEAQSEQAFLTRGTVNEACEYYFGAKVD